MKNAADVSDLEALDARQLVQPIRSRVTIWHARSAFLAVVARQPKRSSPAADALAGQCVKLIEELKREREQLVRDASAARFSGHRLVVSSLAEVDRLLSKLNESLDGLSADAPNK